MCGEGEAINIPFAELADGVFVTATGHATTYEQRTSQEIRWRDFWVDIGCSSRTECEQMGIYPGTPIIWNPSTRRLGDHRIVGKAMDDRAGQHGIVTRRASYGVDGSYASDGLRLVAFGIPSVLTVFPAAYTHRPFEMIDERDLLALTDLLCRFLVEPDRWYDSISG